MSTNDLAYALTQFEQMHCRQVDRVLMTLQHCVKLVTTRGEIVVIDEDGCSIG